VSLDEGIVRVYGNYQVLKYIL